MKYFILILSLLIVIVSFLIPHLWIRAIIVVAAMFLIAWIFRAKKEEPENDQQNALRTYINEHGEPEDVIVANPVRGNELSGVILVYRDHLVGGGQHVNRNEVVDCTFNNASNPYIGNEYQLVITTTSLAVPVVRLSLGSDAHWASEVLEQLGKVLSEN